MKKITYIVFAALAFLSFAMNCSAQKYKPKDKWPYEYSDFVEGSVRTKTGTLLDATQLNVSVATGMLNYVSKDKKIMEADMRTVFTARLGEAVYLNANGRMMKVLAEGDGCAVLECVEVDKEEFGKVSIGYGISSSTASAEDRSAALATLGQFTIQQDLEEAMLNKEGGKELPTITRKYIWAQNKAVPASKVDVLDYFDVDKSGLNNFVKQNKIKWNDVESLLKVAEYLSK